MSIRVMSMVWSMSPYRGEMLLVHLALADWSNDNGECWPSMEQIAAKARITVRGAQGIVHRIIDDGLLQLVRPGGGRGNRPHYQLLKGEGDSPFTVAKGESDSAFVNVKGEPDSRKRVKVAAEKGERSCNAIRKEPSVNRQDEPSIRKPSVAGDVIANWTLPDCIPRENWTAFVEMRQAMRQPLTPKATMLIINKLSKLRAEGHDPAAVLDESVMNNWKGVFPLRRNGDRHWNGTAYKKHAEAGTHETGAVARIKEREERMAVANG